MSVFTVVIIIGVIYQLVTAVTKKKGPQQTPGKLSDSFKLPDGRSISEAIQGTSRGTWREQLKQALENGPNQTGPLQSAIPEDYEESMDYVESMNYEKRMDFAEAKDDYVETEGTQGTEGTSEYVGILGAEAYKRQEETLGEVRGRNSSGVCLSLSKRELVQGVIWAEILGKPRAMHPFRGPRT